MIEYLTQNFNFITYGFEIIALIIGALHFRKYKNSTTKYFVYFLLYIVFVELVGACFFYTDTFFVINFLRSLGINSTVWYNVFWMIGSVLFIIYYFYSLISLKLFKVFTKITALIFLVAMIVHVYIHPNLFLTSHPSFYQLSGALATFISIALYFIQLLNSDAIIDMFRTFGFYASIGLFVWWLIITPVLFFDIYNSTSDWDYANLKRLIFLFANIFMYTCFSIGLFISKPELKND